MPPFSLLVKPAGADCNLGCRYCFYREKATLYPQTPHPRMTEKTLRELLRRYPAGSIAFQGGEPTLMGEAFYRRAAEIAAGGIDFSIQTNGTLITPSFAEFLAGNDWLVGLSIDGPEPLHDRYREQFAAVRRGYDRLMAAGAKTNTMTLVSKANIGHAEEVYRFLRDELGSKNQQYIECTAPASCAISGEEWGEFLCRLFDAWFFDGDTHRISIRLFDSIISKLVFGSPLVCQFAADCRNYLVVEWNGDVYPCDFHVEKAWKLGNIHENPLEELWESAKMRDFGLRKQDWPEQCGKCEYLAFCMGDCPRNRPTHSAGCDDPVAPQAGRATLRQPSVMCAGYKRFFAYALPRLESLAASI